MNEKLAHVGKFEILHELDTLSFVKDGFPNREIKGREASNWVQFIFRKAWEAYAKKLGLLSYAYSNDMAFHVSREQARIGQRFNWGMQGEKRSSMLPQYCKEACVVLRCDRHTVILALLPLQNEVARVVFGSVRRRGGVRAQRQIGATPSSTLCLQGLAKPAMARTVASLFGNAGGRRAVYRFGRRIGRPNQT